MKRTLHLRLRPRPEALRCLRARVDACLEEAGAPPPARHAVLVALQEWLTNIARHGYSADGRGWVALSLSVEPDRVRVRLVDQAPPFDPTRIPARCPTEPRTGGYGVYLIRRLMDDVRYRRRRGCNVLFMTRRFTP